MLTLLKSTISLEGVRIRVHVFSMIITKITFNRLDSLGPLRTSTNSPRANKGNYPPITGICNIYTFLKLRVNVNKSLLLDIK